MKRFEFSLNKLLSFKRQVLKREKNDLANLRRQQQQAIDQQEDIRQKLRHSNDEYVKNTNKGMHPQHIVLAKGYMNSLSQQVFELEKYIIAMNSTIEKQLLVVVEATKEVSSLEKLEGKQLEDYTYKVQKSEELFIEEYVSNAAHNA